MSRLINGTHHTALRPTKENYQGTVSFYTGVLGGIYALNGFDPIKAIPNGVYLTGFFSNYPDQKVMDDIFAFIKGHEVHPAVGAVYSFENIAQVLFDMDHHHVNGKIVVTVS